MEIYRERQKLTDTSTDTEAETDTLIEADCRSQKSESGVTLVLTYIHTNRQVDL